MSRQIYNRTVQIDGIDLFYREAGSKTNPTLLLLHGFPTSSIAFKNLMIMLSDRYHLVAPDYPGFGFSQFPVPDDFAYTFAGISALLNRLCETIGLDRFFIYLHDYGSPIGLRLCLDHPEKIAGIIVQSGNAHRAGMGPQWDEYIKFWDNPTAEKRKELIKFISADGTRNQYFGGLPEDVQERVSPELWLLDWELLKRPGNIEKQFELNCDFKTHMQMFPAYRTYFQKFQPPALVIWGKYEIFFSVEEVACYAEVLPDAQIHVLDGGHDVLDTHFNEVSELIRRFLDRQRRD
ncbi:alpha/beta fold hydrolase [Pedobacter sp. SYP-B3415]|uniref:alpha/beta fold hydrolase n=1 Tax=Pedobacter sp. SYP-B3415 TaxID=2496641 RepID=UPI00101BB803|nr:alpha/beta hydrolase [Pedobacter sp. SYP-B3415]